MFKPGDKVRVVNPGMNNLQFSEGQIYTVMGVDLSFVELTESGEGLFDHRLELAEPKESRFTETVTTTRIKCFRGKIAGREFRVEESGFKDSEVYICNTREICHYTKSQLQELIDALEEIKEAM